MQLAPTKPNVALAAVTLVKLPVGKVVQVPLIAISEVITEVERRASLKPNVIEAGAAFTGPVVGDVELATGPTLSKV